MKYLIYTTIAVLLFIVQPLNAQQKSIKVDKQRTHFFYTSLNLQAGYFGEKEDMHWMPINRSPLNQLSFAYKSKRKRLLQKGYTRFIHLSDIKAKVALCYDNDMSVEGKYSSEGRLGIKDLWIKLATKWDRTSLKIGNFSLPFGHNPKVDPDYSFIPNIGGTDLGLSRDFGFLFKTPVSNMLDLELSLTSGGLLGSPILRKKIITPENEDKPLEVTKIKYDGDWLLTGRLGNPVFKKNELGLFAIVGKLSNASSSAISTRVYRVGFDWINKHKEDFRMTHQLLLGPSVPSIGDSYLKIVQQSNAEFFFRQQWIAYMTNNIQYISYPEDSIIKGTVSSGIAYAFNPHVRLKLNAFSSYNLHLKTNEFGFFFQVIAGFGLK